jgi:hypothetical protein
VRRKVFRVLLIVGAAMEGFRQKPPLLPDKDVPALANELSGETAKRNLQRMASFHRQRGSQGFHEAGELLAERLRAYGLARRGEGGLIDRGLREPGLRWV